MSDFVTIDSRRIAIDGQIWTKGDFTQKTGTMPTLVGWLNTTNWKSELSGLVALAMGFVLIKPTYFPAWLFDVAQYLAVGAGAAFVHYVPDKDKLNNPTPPPQFPETKPVPVTSTAPGEFLGPTKDGLA